MASRSSLSESYALESVIERMIAQACCCLPGIVEDFNPGPPPIAKVVPAIKRKVIGENKPRYIKMPVILNVPVVVPFSQSAGLLMTLPVKKGDEGLIVFSDRMIDEFVEKGGFQSPECCGPENETTEPRAHSLTDAIFIPGIISKPQGKDIVDWKLDAIEIRNRDRSAFISLGTNGAIRMKSPVGVFFDAPTVNATNEIIGKDVRTHEGFDANPHLHSDVMPGSANTGTYV